MMFTPTDSSLPLRRSARLVLLNDADELLLMKVTLPTRSFWCTVGGGIEPGESPAQAARREAFEETGLRDGDLQLGPMVWHGTHVLALDGVLTQHDEHFFMARTGRRTLAPAGLTAAEQAVVTALRWWPLAELEATAEHVVPPDLAYHVQALRVGLPAAPLTIALADTADGAP